MFGDGALKRLTSASKRLFPNLFGGPTSGNSDQSNEIRRMFEIDGIWYNLVPIAVYDYNSLNPGWLNPGWFKADGNCRLISNPDYPGVVFSIVGNNSLPVDQGGNSSFLLVKHPLEYAGYHAYSFIQDFLGIHVGGSGYEGHEYFLGRAGYYLSYEWVDFVEADIPDTMKIQLVSVDPRNIAHFMNAMKRL